MRPSEVKPRTSEDYQRRKPKPWRGKLTPRGFDLLLVRHFGLKPERGKAILETQTVIRELRDIRRDIEADRIDRACDKLDSLISALFDPFSRPMSGARALKDAGS